MENGPLFEGDIPIRSSFRKRARLWDFELNSPLGVPAGPLFNSDFIKLYADLGFDVLVYKTVRSVARKAHPNPNIVFVDPGAGITKDRLGSDIVVGKEPSDLSKITITNSFGMNSLGAEDWQKDFDLAQSYMGDGQLLMMSVTSTPGESGRDMKEDFVYTAALAKDAGAKVVELNFSCPNVKAGGEGSIYTDPDFSAEIVAAVKKELGATPVVIKVGYYKDLADLDAVAAAVAPFVDGISAINTITMLVRNGDGSQALPGEGRLGSGLCGAALKPYALETVGRLAELKRTMKYDYEIFGVGGVVRPEDFDDLLEAGATVAMTGTGAMWNPMLALQWNEAV